MEPIHINLGSKYIGWSNNKLRNFRSKKNRKLFESWNKSDPVDEWECERAKRIEKIQGNRNKVVIGNC